MRIGSWNVNSIRARVDQVERWLVERSIDVALLQETRCTNADFPSARFESLGYEVAHHGINQWNGVAILSRVGLADVRRGFDPPVDSPFDEPRLVTATCRGISCMSVYVPNGRGLDDPWFDIKLKWLGHLGDQLQRDDVAHALSLVAGDFNVGLSDLDFYDADRWRGQKHATPEERSAVHALLDLGLVDLARSRHPDTPMFTWWNHAANQFGRDRGLRIDLALGSSALAERVDDVWVDRHARDPLVAAPMTPSDHAPVIVDLV